MRQICQHCSKLFKIRKDGIYRVFEFPAGDGITDRNYGAVIDDVGYDVGIGGGILFAPAIRFAHHKAEWLDGCGECVEVVEK